MANKQLTKMCDQYLAELAAERKRANQVVENAVQLLTDGCHVDHRNEPFESFKGCIICERQRARMPEGALRFARDAIRDWEDGIASVGNLGNALRSVVAAVERDKNE